MGLTPKRKHCRIPPGSERNMRFMAPSMTTPAEASTACNVVGGVIVVLGVAQHEEVAGLYIWLATYVVFVLLATQLVALFLQSDLEHF
jgi:hypothetical protein